MYNNDFIKFDGYEIAAYGSGYRVSVEKSISIACSLYDTQMIFTYTHAHIQVVHTWLIKRMIIIIIIFISFFSFFS